MSENPIENMPDFLRALVQPGKEEDGSYTVSVLFRVTPKDEVGLRSEYLNEPADSSGNPFPMDWGIEAALARKIGDLVGNVSDANLDFGQTDVRCGGTVNAIPPHQ